jgi:hypothetical protein
VFNKRHPVNALLIASNLVVSFKLELFSLFIILIFNFTEKRFLASNSSHTSPSQCSFSAV